MTVQDLKCGITDIDRFLQYDENGKQRTIWIDRNCNLIRSKQLADGSWEHELHPANETGTGTYMGNGIFYFRIGGAIVKENGKSVEVRDVYGCNNAIHHMVLYTTPSEEESLSGGRELRYTESLILNEEGNPPRWHVVHVVMNSDGTRDEANCWSKFIDIA